VLNDTCSGSGNYARIYQPYIGGSTGRNPKRVMPPDISAESGNGTSLSPPTGS